MNTTEISECIPSLAYAQLLYAHGKLADLLVLGSNELTDDWYSVFYDALSIAVDFVYCDYVEEYNGDKWYFSSEDMMTYYCLCRIYGSAHHRKLTENPYLSEAQRFVENAMDLGNQGGYAWWLNTKINHRWASGIVFQTDESFCGEFELLAALLELRAYYADGVYRLRKKLLEEWVLRLPALSPHEEASVA